MIYIYSFNCAISKTTRDAPFSSGSVITGMSIAPRRRDATFRPETLTVSPSRLRARVREGGREARKDRRGHHAYPSGRSSSSFPDNGESANARRKDDDWRRCEASRPDPARDTGVKCFDCFEWCCRMSITRRRLDVETGTFESGASRLQHCAGINLDSTATVRKPRYTPDVSIHGTHVYPRAAEKGLTRR